jgi:hypothetical protein
MEKPKKEKKAKKPLNVEIDTPKVDLTINRDKEGNINAEIDTPKVDVTYTKTEEGTKIAVTIEDGKEYLFESNGTSRKLPRGVWKITGELARLFLKQGFGKLKNK